VSERTEVIGQWAQDDLRVVGIEHLSPGNGNMVIDALARLVGNARDQAETQGHNPDDLPAIDIVMVGVHAEHGDAVLKQIVGLLTAHAERLDLGADPTSGPGCPD